MGGGASLLVDRLIERGFTNLTVVDVSAAALKLSQERLGPRADGVHWLQADARFLKLPQPIDLWHDRAVFHFLTGPEDQAAYVGSLLAALRPGGHVVMATFALDGPHKCSGLDVARYSPETLAVTLGAAFALVRASERTHLTPAGLAQRFTYTLFRRIG